MSMFHQENSSYLSFEGVQELIELDLSTEQENEIRVIILLFFICYKVSMKLPCLKILIGYSKAI